ncbi:MAG: tRNA uridine-5-carboxymethylaminomethyl(34) synthesis GTPase MnmE [Bacteroides sp.]|nr:tRNA uridine-5-carboxymethylaminomethyl(34) synthesis GTPase MnmE [Bacillota bacterium]MCM1394107.1 tRNA uridine-5-carboxymethylaminomethyl(34) synthesis GTPase MnmE [[Eubacterium] siraeum]MCM1455940.1 tRNA uridine-5-carboxymethylaminomethyl(34) synthesis GTPase MnmE [Bacteroides sp.]
MKTIAAISSPIGAGGIGIVRVSGNDALGIADAIFNFGKDTRVRARANNIVQPWEPLKMHFGTFVAKDFCDRGYAVYFPADKAYTGEDTVEFYLHGGVRIMRGALDALLDMGATLAEHGEFTKRAFLAGRLSLADAEGVIDMINADSAAGLRAAYRLMDGEVAKSVDGIADELKNLIAGLEATLDYPEETEDEVLPSLESGIDACLKMTDGLLSTASRGRIAKHGINVVLAGGVNAGKSSLMNAMLKEERAIVADVAGTTRDTVEDSIEYEGVRINLVDTAGLRESDDAIETQGVARARRAIEGADIVLHVIDKTNPVEDEADLFGKLVFTVYNKCDIAGFAIPRMAYTFGVSAKTGEGVDELVKAIASAYGASGGSGGELITNERHVSALLCAKRALESAKASLNYSADCILIDLRAAYDALGQITGKTANDEIIDTVFSKFCVGK